MEPRKQDTNVQSNDPKRKEEEKKEEAKPVAGGETVQVTSLAAETSRAACPDVWTFPTFTQPAGSANAGAGQVTFSCSSFNFPGATTDQLLGPKTGERLLQSQWPYAQEQGGGKRRKAERTADDLPDGGGRSDAAQEESGGDGVYSFNWFRFAEALNTGDDVPLTGAKDAADLCDEPVDEEMVRVGLGLLNSLVGQPTSIAGPWTEDVAAGRARTKLVVEGFVSRRMSEFDEIEARVYRAPSANASGELDRFELTHLACGEILQYVIVIDRVARRFALVGECGGHPHVGTNDFTYQNSDGSGPGLLLDPTAPPTPTNLLFSAAQRFGEYCLDQNH